ncbi:MAG: acyl-CoA dehydratase activase [Phycisphaerae bacterium]|nr:acyl-CoA dehydratase activase [Phycisphaerae bacterium]
MQTYAGIDAGSRTIKIILMDAGGRVVASGLRDQGVEVVALTEELLDGLLGRADLERSDLGQVVATGYARNAIASADTTITEITCHAAGVRHQTPHARTIVEIGGQDSKVIHLDDSGQVRDFAMNDRCAAGTGRFLEVVADKLEVPLDALGDLAAKSTSPAAISSMCVVFAETEIIGLLAGGEERANIVAGVQHAITSRVAAMIGPNARRPIIFTGGVAMVPGVDRALADSLGAEIQIADEPQMTGALGAAILASCC